MTNAGAGGPMSADRIHIAAGDGILARRRSALLYIPESGVGVEALLDAFAGADDATAVEAVTDTATAAGFDIGPFVLVDWADELHVVVLGPVEVRTDHASLPMLSGAGSGSWVERRVRVGTGAITVETGDAAAPATDLQLGRVSAGGFAATFTTSRPTTSHPEPEPATSTTTSTTSTTIPAAATSTTATPAAPVTPVGPAAASAAPTVSAPHAEPTTTPTPADPTGPIATDRLAALRAAMRAPSEPIATAPVPPDTPEVTPPPPPSIDDEATLAPDDPPVGAPTSPPEPEPDADADDRTQAPFVAARRCGRGHLNPPHVGACRTCGDLLDATAATEQVRQPPLATLDLDDDLVPIDRPLVLGRKPDIGAAQATDRARLVVLAEDASVSRTHARIDVEDWTLTVTDCGSRSGTAIVARPGEEPRILEPWVAHELPIGARLFLGGPTSVVVRPAGVR